MNKIKVYSILAFIFVATITTFNGCNKRDDITSPNNIDFNSPAFALVDYTDLTNSIDDATLDSPLAINSTMSNYGFLKLTDFNPDNMTTLSTTGGGRWMLLFDWSKQLGLTFRRMNLTSDQIVAIRELLAAYHNSFKSLVDNFAASNQSIIDDANVKRQTIISDFKAGKITRADAAIKLNTLNETTRKAIENNPASLRIKNAMCTLRANLLTAIGGKLTGDQITKWRLIVSQLKSPCQ